jgi:hypothetical protein
MNLQDKERARHELLELSEELAGQYWGGRWFGGMHYLLWRMAHGGSNEGWPSESLPTGEQLRRLCDLSQRAGGWWHRQGESDHPEFVPLSIWRRHYWFLQVALRLTWYASWLFVLLCTLVAVTWAYHEFPTARLPAGVLAGFFVFAYLVICFSNWPRMLLWLLRPIGWLVTGRRLW